MAGIGKSVATRIFSSLLTSTTDVPKEAEARVTRVDEDGVPWVAIAGSDEETPANGSVTSEAQVGQTVRVSVQGGKLSIVGNSTSPSVGGEYVQRVVAPIEELAEETSIAVRVTSAVANAANTVAKAAQAIAQATNQHFFADGQGIHVTEAEGDATTEHNILINSLGFMLRKATVPLSVLSASAIAFYDGLGDAATNIMARIGADGSQIGPINGNNVEITSDSIAMRFAHNSMITMRSGYSYTTAQSLYEFTATPSTHSSTMVGVDENGDEVWEEEEDASVINLYSETITPELPAGAAHGWIDLEDITYVMPDLPALEVGEELVAYAKGQDGTLSELPPGLTVKVGYKTFDVPSIYGTRYVRDETDSVIKQERAVYAQGYSRYTAEYVEWDNTTGSDVTVCLCRTVLTSSGDAEMTIGDERYSHVGIDYHSMQLIDREGGSYFYVSDLRNAEGVAEIVAMFTGDGTTRSFNLSPTAIDTDYTVTVSDSSGGTVTKNTRFISFGTAPTDGATITVTYETDSQMAKAFTYGSRGTGNVGALSFAAGRDVVASESFSHAEGENTRASGRCSHAEGSGTGARGDGSHAEGGGSSASGSCAHAEGNLTIASAANAHAEGGSSYATGLSSHAEGNNVRATGDMSHAEGDNTVASGRASHAQGEGTIAAGDSQTVLGRHNEEDANDTYALIIGNGTAYDARSNALTVDWIGNVWAAGKATLDGAIEAASATISGAISAASATISGLLTADRVKIAAGGAKGLLTTDSTGFEYPLITDNGNNLWIGAHKAGEAHHTGGTFISAGAGRDTIYVSVPNSDNTAGTNYSVMHSGYAPVETSTISDIISAQTNVTVSAATFAQWGKVAMLNVTYTLSSEISVPANGNTTNTALFTIAAGKRPAMVLGIILDNNEGAWGTVNANGVVTLAGANSRGAAWTMNATNNRYLQICYLLP